ncbi:hypothetical protein AXF42_Ash005330 [Apostasia shenzhenica]|uniref:Uncharacterized protein n=1 Tax=Apostasia shenzhenica TaxID=1088818 RepID=A0A2I0B6M5_9ASPA|nr:hypothetical protein AXF42_Ash005330 [Apostasia shenzhenica]
MAEVLVVAFDRRCQPECGRKLGLRRRCAAMAKQQKTRFYILSRCISMLLCWHAHNLSD